MGGNNGQVKKKDHKEIAQMVMFGQGGVGKTALTIRFCSNHFVEEYDPTIEDSYRKQFVVDDVPQLGMIMDTAGEEQYDAMYDHYIREHKMMFLIFSLTDKRSFAVELPQRIERIRGVKDEQGEEYYFYLIGNKKDLEDNREITKEEAVKFAEEEGMPYMETSAKTNEGVEEMFVNMTRMHRDNTHPQLGLGLKARNIKGAI
eukprot:CAMPEP_0201541724 /NCGR_PEP_ID=MMETSP0161_2-20130828/71630_1 /ASSEMBLY_ACC=CAM_ASM_000251 /TAXON_ID=180227 /ORGANISM="Neoparamoeba aestuarina, Strain SoJaBio B1-5/56/2" /LENGTH=201 /DNA_ID=CAMNT_0047949281 /DNA_START=117 /DNA_END=722 /DNA_ORIENTATION=+